MPIANCERCGTLFSKVDRSICSACTQKEEAEFQKALEWVRAHPNQNLSAISEATGVAKRDLLRWVREQRLMFSGESPLPICRKCGRMIDTGTLCQLCKATLSEELSDNSGGSRHGKPKGEGKGRGMHYSPRNRRRR